MISTSSGSRSSSSSMKFDEMSELAEVVEGGRVGKAKSLDQCFCYCNLCAVVWKADGRKLGLLSLLAKRGMRRLDAGSWMHLAVVDRLGFSGAVVSVATLTFLICINCIFDYEIEAERLCWVVGVLRIAVQSAFINREPKVSAEVALFFIRRALVLVLVPLSNVVHKTATVPVEFGGVGSHGTAA